MSNPAPAAGARSASAVVVNTCQRGNPLLKHVKNVPWEYGDTLADFQVGKRNCILFLSLKYHKLHPNYVYERLKLLGKEYLGRFILVLVDTKDHHRAIRELTRVCVILDFTVVLAWSLEEAGRYIETFKAFETKTPDAIKEKPAASNHERLVQSLTSIQAVNKTDAQTLLTNFASFADIANSDKGALQMCPGLGAQKIRRMLEAFDEPFRRGE